MWIRKSYGLCIYGRCSYGPHTGLGRCVLERIRRLAVGRRRDRVAEDIGDLCVEHVRRHAYRPRIVAEAVIPSTDTSIHAC